MKKVDLTAYGDKTDKLLEFAQKTFPSPEVATVGLIIVAMYLAQEYNIPDELIQNTLVALDEACNISEQNFVQ